MKWGLLGGTFDPIHFGHLRAAEEIRDLLALDSILFLPAFQQPHKTDRPTASFDHREQMLRLAIAGNTSFVFSDIEKLRQGKSYSVETVEYILKKYQEDMSLYFITGQDAFQAITTWKEWEKLLSLCNFAVMTRPGYENRGLREILTQAVADKYIYDREINGYKGDTGKVICFRHVTYLDISSSAIRENVRAGKSINYLTPENVRLYIERNGLYRE